AAVQAAWNMDGGLVDGVLRGFVAHPLIAEAELDVRGMERVIAAPGKGPSASSSIGALMSVFVPDRRDVRLMHDERMIGRLILHVNIGEAAAQIDNRLRRNLLGSLALTVAIAGALILLLRRSVAQPVERLIARIDGFDAEAPPPPLALTPGKDADEIHRLERAYIGLLHNLQRNRQDLAMASRRLNAAIVGADLVAFEADIDEDGVSATTWTTANIAAFLGYPQGVKPPRSAWRDALHPEDARRVTEAERRHIASGSTDPLQSMYRLVTQDERVIVVETTAVVERDADGKPLRLAGVNRNVTARFEAERRIAELASKDSLTGLGNRASLERALEGAIANGKRNLRQTAAIHLDIDKFKIINDTYGHGVADRVLRLMGWRWAKLLPDGAAIHRLGGDEFVVTMRDVAGAAAAIRLAEKLNMATEDPLPDELPPISLTASVGVAMLPLDGDTPEEALMALGYAVQAAKQAGGGCVRLYQTRHGETVKTRIQMEKELAEAVARDELSLHYQPRVSPDGRMLSVEALARWITPQRTVPPGVFIPMAEETGLIIQLGLWALRAACRQAHDWRAVYGAHAPKVAVNVSARQLMQPHFEADVANALREAGVSPDMVELELTESAALGQIDDARQKVLKLRELGVGVAVDDFGTGYSALSYIAKLPFTAVKIDQSFTRELPDAPAARAVVTAALQIAHDLDMAVVAEGVETREQADYLIRCGAHELQGYFYARPLPPDQLAAQWLSGKVVALRRGEGLV
ncbi:MAG TPA: EAL domain-containing protein, partial [Azospirillaceae bacterium]|nr:EAL domain-containing protein [Azospirillaceae bacterium]